MIIRILKKAMDMVCPKATQDVALNTKNRNATRENHMYGPLNVEEPGDYWEKLAKKGIQVKKPRKKYVRRLCGVRHLPAWKNACLGLFRTRAGVLATAGCIILSATRHVLAIHGYWWSYKRG